MSLSVRSSGCADAEVIYSIVTVHAKMWKKLSAEISLGLGFYLKEELWWRNAESLLNSSKTTTVKR